jgi:hypothetical protein
VLGSGTGIEGADFGNREGAIEDKKVIHAALRVLTDEPSPDIDRVRASNILECPIPTPLGLHNGNARTLCQAHLVCPTP